MRADWRFLVPWHDERAPVIRVDADRREAWMEADGWAVDRGPADVVATTHATTPSLSGPADSPSPNGSGADGSSEPRHLITWVTGFGRGPAVPIPAGHRVRRYLPVPRVAQPRSYVPLDHVPALSRWLAPRLPHRVLARPLAITVRLIGPLLPGTVIVATSPDGDTWPEPATDVLVTTSGHLEASRVVRFLVGDDGEPLVVEKLSNRPEYDFYSTDEQRSLALVARSLPSEMAGTFPQPLGRDQVAGSVRVRESYCPGLTISQTLSRWTTRARAEQVLNDAAGQLLDVQRATQRPGVWTEIESEEFLRQPLGELRERTGLPLVAVGRLVDAVAELADSAAMARSFRHYDPGPWNLVLGSRVGMVDWELGPPRPDDRIGLAGADLLYLITYWRHLVVRTRTLRDEARVAGLLPPGTRRYRWAFEASQAVLRQSFAASGLSSESGPAIWVHNWLDHAVHQLHRRPSSVGGRALVYLEDAAADPDRLLDPFRR